MKTYTRYSEGFKEHALAKVYSRGNAQSIQDVAEQKAMIARNEKLFNLQL